MKKEEKAKKSAITLSGRQILNLLILCAPDYDNDEEQLETEMTVFYKDAFVSDDGDEMPSGVYCIYTEYPEEGFILLSKKSSD